MLTINDLVFNPPSDGPDAVCPNCRSNCVVTREVKNPNEHNHIESVLLCYTCKMIVPHTCPPAVNCRACECLVDDEEEVTWEREEKAKLLENFVNLAVQTKKETS
jgi:hypothetical protein